jgi:hypothetical protein
LTGNDGKFFWEVRKTNIYINKKNKRDFIVKKNKYIYKGVKAKCF